MFSTHGFPVFVRPFEHFWKQIPAAERVFMVRCVFLKPFPWFPAGLTSSHLQELPTSLEHHSAENAEEDAAPFFWWPYFLRNFSENKVLAQGWRETCPDSFNSSQNTEFSSMACCWRLYNISGCRWLQACLSLSTVFTCSSPVVVVTGTKTQEESVMIKHDETFIVKCRRWSFPDKSSEVLLAVLL